MSAEARLNMLNKQIETIGNNIPRESQVFLDVPRDFFVANELKSLSYSELNLKSKTGAFMMNPRLLGFMIKEVSPKESDKVLVLGTNSGYEVNLIAKLVKEVLCLDIDDNHSKMAKLLLKQQKVYNVKFLHSEESTLKNGDAKNSKYDIIFANEAFDEINDTLKHQLNINGKIISVVGKQKIKKLIKITRVSEHNFKTKSILETNIPLFDFCNTNKTGFFF